MDTERKDLLSEIYSTLIEADATNSDNSGMLDRLADIICELFNDQYKESIYYFSMPIWDYLHNCWKKPTVARINLNNEKEEVQSEFSQNNENNWIKIEENKDTEKFKNTTYIKFFEKASKNFSFIEFFTQHVKNIRPIFTIDFSTQGSVLYNETINTLFCPPKIEEDQYRKTFIEQTKHLLAGTNEDEKQQKELDAFRIFLSKYQADFPELKYIYLVSSRLYEHESNVYIGSGGVILVCKNKLDDIVLKQISVLTNLCYRELGGKNWAERCRKESIKSAVAALMARNLSHNLGSHDLSNTKNYFRNTVDQIDQLTQELIQADYRGNVRLLQYIQERMDFIATIISGDQYPLCGLNFKAEFFDILTNDDCGARHGKSEKNFLLQYLLYSEKLTRHHNLDEEFTEAKMKEVNLVVKYNGCQIYTGKVGKSEEDIKMELSKQRLAVPGGVMARHALFTLVENILRNAAKHNEHDGDLVLTIKIEKNDGKYKLYFYDNCNSADTKVEVIKKDENGEENKETKTVIEVIREKLSNITIVSEDGKIDKNDKGLKEMLFCAIWLKNKDLSQTLFDIQSKKDNAEKYVRVMKVDNDGNPVESNGTNGHLCYCIDLEKWQEVANLDSYTVKDKSGNDQKILLINEENTCDARIKRDDLLKIHADFVVAEKDYRIKLTEDVDTEQMGEFLSEIFPSFIILGEQNETEKIEDIQKNLTDEYNLVIKYPGEKRDDLPEDGGVFNYEDDAWKDNGKKNIIFYDHAFNEGSRGIWETDEFAKSVYFDSISGENFTQTLTQPEFLKEPGTLYKVIRSAKAKIAIVDERIWENYVKLNRQLAQEEKSNKEFEDVLAEDSFGSDVFFKLKKLNFERGNEIEKKIDEIWDDWSSYDKKAKKDKLRQLWNSQSNFSSSETDKTVLLLKKKNIFIFTIEDGNLIDVENKKFEKSEDFDFDFVSIHLGLLDKGNSMNFQTELLEHYFGKKPFVSIHSGRGNFSPELEDKLKGYPFLSLSALESAFNNSKYLLSEFLYNTNYYGKGNLNN